MANKYTTSTGEQLTQRQIELKRSWAYRNKHNDNPEYWCHGCGQRAQGNAHIIPQARCKQLNKAELIWNWDNFFPACHKCNQAIENPKGESWKKLNNRKKFMLFLMVHDRELYMKFLLNSEIKSNAYTETTTT